MGEIYAYMTETRTLKAQGCLITEKYMNQNSILRGSNAILTTQELFFLKEKAATRWKSMWYLPLYWRRWLIFNFVSWVRFERAQRGARQIHEGCSVKWIQVSPLHLISTLPPSVSPLYYVWLFCSKVSLQGASYGWLFVALRPGSSPIESQGKQQQLSSSGRQLLVKEASNCVKLFISFWEQPGKWWSFWLLCSAWMTRR